MSSSKNDLYDVTPKQRELLEWRHAKRQQLRHEYLKELLNPMRQTIIIDTAYERYAGLRIKHEYTGRILGGYHVFFTAGVVLTFFALLHFFDTTKNNQEAKYRAGEVSYKDREFKFM